MRVALFAAAVIGLVLVVSSRQAEETGKQADRDIRDVAHLLERALEDAPPPRPTPLTGPWIARVNTECMRREQLLEGLRGPGGRDELARHARDVLAIHRGYSRRVAALKPPRRFRAEGATIDRLNARQVQVLSRVAASAGVGDISAASRQARALRVLAGDSNSHFLRLGLTACPFRPSGMPL